MSLEHFASCFIEIKVSEELLQPSILRSSPNQARTPPAQRFTLSRLNFADRQQTTGVQVTPPPVVKTLDSLQNLEYH